MTCKLCAKGVGYEHGKTHVAVAREYGVNESSVRRHRQHTQDFFSDIPQELITKRGKTVRLPDGSYEKVSWNPNAKAMHDALNFGVIEKSLENWEPKQWVDKGSGFTDVLNAADLQIGKAMEWGGGTPQTLQRVQKSFEQFAYSLKTDNPAHAILADNGDIIENIFNTPSQRATNDLSLVDQILTASRVMVEGIKLFAPLVPELTYVAVPSNHGEVRSGPKELASTIDNDFGLLIAKQIEDVVSENPFLKDRVRFVRPEPLYATAVVEVSNTKLAFNHGHFSGKQENHGKWWAGQDHGRLPGWDADILVTGHYHNMRLEQSGNGRWIICCASDDPGSAWFSGKTGEQALPGMTAFKVLDGQWSDLRLL